MATTTRVPATRVPMGTTGSDRSPRKGRLLAISTSTVLAVFIAALHQTIVVTALPTIASDVRIIDSTSWVAQIAWLVAAYPLGSAIALPLFTRLGRHLGYKGLFQVAILIFVAGSVLAGRSDTLTEILASRATQGIGAGGLIIGAHTIVTTHLQQKARARLSRFLGAVFVLATGGGVLLGGALAEHQTWQAGFYASVPVGAVALLMTFGIPKRPRPELTAATTMGRRQRIRTPIVAGIVAFAVGAATFATITYLPVFRELTEGATPTEAGIFLLPMIAGACVSVLTATPLISRFGKHRLFAILGAILAATGMALLSVTLGNSPRWQEYAAMGGLGIGIGLVPPALTVSRWPISWWQLGGCAGTSALGVAFANRLTERLAGASTTAVAEVFPPLLGYGVPLLALAALLAFALKQDPARTQDKEYANPTVSTDDTSHVNVTVPAQQRGAPDDVPERDTQGDTDPLLVRVRQASGEPIPGVVLTLCDLAGRQLGRSIAAGDGGYELTRPSNGTYLLIASARAFHPHAQIIELNDQKSPRELDLTLRGESGVYGVVRSAASIANATVTLTNPRGAVVAGQTTGPDGSYTLADLVPGTYTMVVNAPAYPPAALIVHVPANGTLRQDVELAGGGHLHGVVRGGSGRALSDARLTLVDSWGRVVSVTASGPDGRYRFDELPDGEYTLVTTIYPPAASVLQVTSGQNHQHDVALAYPKG
ncbi:MFS transporter [Actinopolymorpha alba]|uniref:MFS transporter n=1 Tax=Actinopolymorpha alba TaxID=533267 RepID=UPI0003A39E2C|nr:MFS transporter [Actinopolymorpha alba]